MKRMFASILALLLPLTLAAATENPPAGKPITPEQKQAAKTEAPQPPAAPAAEQKDAKWDVNNPPGPKHEITIDTDEGTWMSVDVSPRGDTVVFDLLGDIYTIPITGGEAKALTTGMAWDEHPRFSPNGKYIAFTSDRAGGDNIWVMTADGSNPQQVTSEDFRLLNSPVWTPDGEFIAGRKHYTARRSAGAGEIWLYHRSGGGEGMQMTKRPNDQKDVGEPAFSPDGRYLYYSQDVTPGPVFEYNKDPNSEIYVIQRLDRVTGETERYITGPGGSIRPTPSHDGKSLAFIRRVRAKSVLYVADLRSGSETPIFDGLDRDMQETWAIHGVYPSMAWTPDDKAIVFWSGGKIHRIDVATRQVADIPFHVKATRTIEEALRFPVDVAPESFDVKLLRWPEVSPKGDQVVYQALGHLYVRNLPDGTPRRLTTQNDHLEFYPSYSRDGKWIVYTTWDDQKYGTIRVVSARGGEGKVVSAQPGHYIEPAFTPDGTKIVYRAVADGFLTTPKWSHETGIYWIPASGGKASLITKKGSGPHFGAASDRVFLLNVGDEDKRSLISIALDGAAERTHLTSDSATEFRVSPDEKWVAFTERFNAYIVPFVGTGKTLEIGPDTKALPLARVSRDAGNWLHWSGDSRKLHWSLGPELYTRDLRDAFAFVEGAPEKLPEIPEKGVNISFREKYDIPSGSLAIVGARVITMKGDEVIEDGTVVVNGNRITAVGPRASVPVPAGAKVIDAAGKTVMPGIVDVHWHGSQGSDQITPEQNWLNFSSLAFGVTTIHDPSNDTNEIFSESELEKAGLITAPRIFSTGTILYGAKAPFKAVINNIDDARSHLRRMKAVGAFSVKSYNQPRRDQRQEVIEAARELGMMVVPEGGSLFQHNTNMIVDGHTGVEHSIPVARIYKDVVQLWSQSKVGYTPTLIVGYGGNWGENYWYQKTNVWEDQRLLNFVPRELVDARSRRRTMVPDDEFGHIFNSQDANQLSQAGVSVQLGAHGQREGLGAHWEMWMLAQGGMKPLQVLRAATLDGARYLGMDKDIGSLEAGKLADLLVLDASPLDNIRNTERIRYTIVNGRIFDSMSMNEIGNHPRKREPFFFEDGSSPTIPASALSKDED